MPIRMVENRAPRQPATVILTTTDTLMTTSIRTSPTTHTATRTVTLMAIRTVGRMKTCTVYICTLWECGFLGLTAKINLRSENRKLQPIYSDRLVSSSHPSLSRKRVEIKH